MRISQDLEQSAKHNLDFWVKCWFMKGWLSIQRQTESDCSTSVDVAATI